MTEAPALPQSARPIEVVAPDRDCATMLQEDADGLFPDAIVSGSGLIVSLQPPAGGQWVLDFLSLVERWLESARLSCATVLYGGRSYLIPASTEIAQFRTATASPRALSAEVPTS
jgi:hypothetical protein